MRDICAWPGCRREAEGSFIGKPLCEKHFNSVLSENEATAARARKKLKLPSPQKIVSIEDDEETTEEADLKELEEKLLNGTYKWN